MEIKRINIGLRIDEPRVQDLDVICEKYKYSRSNLTEIFVLKCLDVVDKRSYSFLVDLLDNIVEETVADAIVEAADPGEVTLKDEPKKEVRFSLRDRKKFI